jgi:hypothetical protein
VHRHGTVAEQVFRRLVAADRHDDADVRPQLDLRPGQLRKTSGAAPG